MLTLKSVKSIGVSHCTSSGAVLTGPILDHRYLKVYISVSSQSISTLKSNEFMKIKTKLYTCTININMNPRKALSQLPVGFQNKLYTLINIQDNRNSRYPPKQFKLRNQSINLN